MRTRAIVIISAILLLLPGSGETTGIVISELLWSGSDLSSADEWIEFSNTGSGTVDLGGWQLTKLSEGSETGMLMLPSGSTIASGKTFLISNFDEAHSRLGIAPDLVSTAVSLSNTQLLIRLYDALGSLIDAVDDGVGVPFAGSNGSTWLTTGEESKASMERTLNENPGTTSGTGHGQVGSGQVKESWGTATTFLNFDDGARVFGTPGAPNGSGPYEDTFPPKEAMQFAAEFKRKGSGLPPEAPEGAKGGTGELTVSWVPSISLDLAQQLLSYDPPIANGTGMVLPASATGMTFTEGFTTGTGITFLFRSVDSQGNVSGGVSAVSTLFPQVRITEVLANPAGADDEEWIEIGNLGSEAIDIAGWILDEGNSPDAYTIVPPSGSALLLQPGEHASFHKPLTGLPLGNDGEQLTLSRGLTVMDTWSYPETAEEVSYGRDIVVADTFRAFCVSTEGQPNAVIPSDPHIIIQSLSSEALAKEDGGIEGENKVTINLTVEVSTGSLAHAACNWDYGDGFTSDSCNPPSHTFAVPGDFVVRLTYTNFCEEVIERSLPISVLSPPPPPPAPSGVEGPPPAGGGERSGGSAAGNRTSCTPSFFSGIRLSEFLPNPVGDDTEHEWIELENALDGTVSLCGWALDDREGGSAPHILDTYTIPPQSFLLLERQKTHIAINNSAESIRLFGPGTTLIEEVSFEESTEGESYALRQDGAFVWTPLLTPGEPNRFREATRAHDSRTVSISTVLPNPDGKDEGREWIEITNEGTTTVDLSGWQLDDGEGGSKPYRLGGVILEPQEQRRFLSEDTGVELTNTYDLARLLDPQGNVISLLAWRDAASGQIYRPATFAQRVQATVTEVIDGDTIDVNISGVRERVRLLGIDAPESVHPFKPLERFGVEAREFLRSMVIGKTVTLLLDREPRDRYNRLLAYVILPDGTNVNGELVRRGFAEAYLRFPFALADLFATYEEEARRAKWGLWADAAITEFMAQEQQQTIQETFSGALANTFPATLTGSYELPEKYYVLAVTFSEVMSNPPEEGPEAETMSRFGASSLHELGEYVELFNATDVDADLGGWTLDDAVNASAKPYMIPLDTVVPLHRYVVFPSSKTHVSLNNEGEELSLTSPDGKVSMSVTYPKMRRGEAFAWSDEGWLASSLDSARDKLRLSEGWPAGRSSPQAGEGWCLTSLPTPGEPNICRPATIAARTTIQRKTSKRANERMVLQTPDPLTSLRVRYRSVFLESEPACPAKLCAAERSGEPQPLLPPLLAALEPQIIDPLLPPSLKSTKTTQTRVVVNVFAAVLSFLTFVGVALARTLEGHLKDGSLALPVLQ